MAQWSKALATLAEDQSSVPSIHVVAHNYICNFNLRGNMIPLFWYPWALHACAQTYEDKTLIQI